MSPSFILNPNQEPQKSWIKKFKKKYDKVPEYPHMYAYDMANIILDSATRFCAPTNTESLTKAIEMVDIPGVTGKLKFDAMGDIVSSVENVELGVVKNGTMMSVNEAR